MENDVFDGLQSLGYEGELLNEGGLEKALCAGVKSAEYRQAVIWLTGQLKSLCNLDEEVHDIDSPEDTNMFMLELSGFLKDMGCQYKFLTEGYASERLQTQESRLLLLHYLLTELQAAKMVAVNQVQKPVEVTLNETSTACELKTMLMALQLGKPPDNISPGMLFGKVEQRLKEVLKSAPPELVGKPLFIGVLSDQQWHTLAELNKDLQQEYQIRREMLIKRLDVTVQSFQWSDRVQGKENLIASVMESQRGGLVRNPAVRLSDLLAAREDLAIIEKTSNATVRKHTQTKLNKLIIGQVPDRGGRTTDQAAPPPEMPSWQKDRNAGGWAGGRGGRGGRGGQGGHGGQGGGGRGGQGGGGFGGGGGGRVQGGWNQGGDRNDRGDRGRGGHRGDRGGQHHDRRGQYQDRGGQYQDRGGQYQDRGGQFQDRGGQDRERGGQYQDRGRQYQDRDRGGQYQNRGQYKGRGKWWPGCGFLLPDERT